MPPLRFSSSFAIAALLAEFLICGCSESSPTAPAPMPSGKPESAPPAPAQAAVVVDGKEVGYESVPERAASPKTQSSANVVPTDVLIAQAQTSRTNALASDEKASAKTPEAALDEAIALLEAGDLKKFIEDYVPIDEFRRMRDSGALKQIRNGALPGSLQQGLKELKRFQGGNVELDESGLVARISPKPVEPVDAAEAKAETPKPVAEVRKPEDDKLQLVGFSEDIKATLKLAATSLEGGHTDEFVDRLFPAGELGRLQERDGKAKLLANLKANPELVARMISDLKEMQAMKPEMSDDGKVATFVLPARPVDASNPSQPTAKPQEKRRSRRQQVDDGKVATSVRPAPAVEASDPSQPTAKPRPRTFKFQKVVGAWRFFDNSTGARNEIARQATLAPPELPIDGSPGDRSLHPDTLTLERLGPVWRFVSLPRM